MRGFCPEGVMSKGFVLRGLCLEGFLREGIMSWIPKSVEDGVLSHIFYFSAFS